MKLQWNDIASDPRYEQASPEIQQRMKQDYFNNTVAPDLPEGANREEYYSEFLRRTGEAPKPSTNDVAEQAIESIQKRDAALSAKLRRESLELSAQAYEAEVAGDKQKALALKQQSVLKSAQSNQARPREADINMLTQAREAVVEFLPEWMGGGGDWQTAPVIGNVAQNVEKFVDAATTLPEKTSIPSTPSPYAGGNYGAQAPTRAYSYTTRPEDKLDLMKNQQYRYELGRQYQEEGFKNEEKARQEASGDFALSSGVEALSMFAPGAGAVAEKVASPLLKPIVGSVLAGAEGAVYAGGEQMGRNVIEDKPLLENVPEAASIGALTASSVKGSVESASLVNKMVVGHKAGTIPLAKLKNEVDEIKKKPHYERTPEEKEKLSDYKALKNGLKVADELNKHDAKITVAEVGHLFDDPKLLKKHGIDKNIAEKVRSYFNKNKNVETLAATVGIIGDIDLKSKVKVTDQMKDSVKQSLNEHIEASEHGTNTIVQNLKNKADDMIDKVGKGTREEFKTAKRDYQQAVKQAQRTPNKAVQNAVKEIDWDFSNKMNAYDKLQRAFGKESERQVNGVIRGLHDATKNIAGKVGIRGGIAFLTHPAGALLGYATREAATKIHERGSVSKVATSVKALETGKPHKAAIKGAKRTKAIPKVAHKAGRTAGSMQDVDLSFEELYNAIMGE